MDFRKLAKYIIVIGIASISLGTFLYAFKPPKEDFIEYFARMEVARKCVVTGGVITLVGIVVYASAKKNGAKPRRK